MEFHITQFMTIERISVQDHFDAYTKSSRALITWFASWIISRAVLQFTVP